MVKVSNIVWLSREILEAVVTITDGRFELLCFSQPCELKKNEIIKSNPRAFEPEHIIKLEYKSFKAEKLSTPFGYYIEGELADKNKGVISLGEIKVELDRYSIPGDIEAGDYVSFRCDRLDL